MSCGIDKQIAINADEPEADECEECGDTMTEYYFARKTWHECDNKQCENSVELDDE